MQFLDEATAGDAELIRFLRQWVGYCLTAETKEHALAFLYGGGGNGKSVFVNTIQGVMGTYAMAAAMETFTAALGDRHPAEVASLQGARLVTSSETEAGRRWAEARIKQLTGGDRMQARFMRQDPFEFQPVAKLTFMGNHAPTISNLDDAMRRRIRIVPFVHKPKQPNPDLEKQLREEWPGILRWAIEGCLDWQRNGLISPASISEATASYFADQDLVQQWMETHCRVEPGNESVFHPSAKFKKKAKAYNTQCFFGIDLLDRGNF